MRGSYNSAVSFLMALFLPVAAFGEAGDGRVKTETRQVSGFTSIDMSGAGELLIREGPSFRVDIRLDGNLLPHYVSKVRAGVLSLGFENGFAVSRITDLEVTVTLPELEALSLSGAVKAKALGRFSGSSLALRLSGSGSVEGDLDYDRLDIDISGAGTTALSGRVDTLSMEISGAGALEGRDLKTSRAKLGLSGSARAELRVKDSLYADLSGASALRYWGDPLIEVRNSGASGLRRAGAF